MNWPDAGAAKPSWVDWAENEAALTSDPDDDLPTTFPEVMNTAQAAEYLGLAQCTVNRAVLRGDLAALEKGKRGKWTTFRKADLDVFLEKKEG